MSVGQRIREIRLNKGLTQKQLSELCGIAEPNIGKYERGEQNPKIETIERIANALNVPVLSIKMPNETQIEQSVTIRSAIFAFLRNNYGPIRTEELAGETGWLCQYYVIGRPPKSFVLYNEDFDVIEDIIKAILPIFIDRAKDLRPEEEIIQEILNELNTSPPPNEALAVHLKRNKSAHTERSTNHE